MQTRTGESRLLWLTVGLLAGLSISYFWPHEPVAAASNDRNDKFGIMTTPVAIDAEGVFVLDYLTGRMTGAVLNTKAGSFGVMYFRSVAQDFNVDPKAKPYYAFVGGTAGLASRGGVTPGRSVIYVGEMTSGKVVAYGMNYKIVPGRVAQPQPFQPLDVLSFRAAAARD